MASILLNASSYIFIILLAYLLKRFGLFGPKDYKIITKVTLNVTLPAAILTSFAAYEVDLSLLLCVPVGFLANWLVLGLALLATKKKPHRIRALWLNAAPGYNIGAFALPFVQNFLSPMSMVSCCLFDAGSAIMCTGGTYALSCGILGLDGDLSPKQIGKKLLRSTPFMSYLIMLIISLAKIPIPKILVDFVSPLAKANPFMAMFMVGLMFDIKLAPGSVWNIVKLLLLRVGTSLLIVLACYFLLPLPVEARQGIALALFAPVSVASAVFSEKAGADPAETACIFSLNIPVSILAFISLLVLFGAM